MKPEKLTVYQLFEKQQRYVVPLFQRPYMWDREQQLQPLQDHVEEAEQFGHAVDQLMASSNSAPQQID